MSCLAKELPRGNRQTPLQHFSVILYPLCRWWLGRQTCLGLTDAAFKFPLNTAELFLSFLVCSHCAAHPDIAQLWAAYFHARFLLGRLAIPVVLPPVRPARDHPGIFR